MPSWAETNPQTHDPSRVKSTIFGPNKHDSRLFIDQEQLHAAHLCFTQVLRNKILGPKCLWIASVEWTGQRIQSGLTQRSPKSVRCSDSWISFRFASRNLELWLSLGLKIKKLAFNDTSGGWHMIFLSTTKLSYVRLAAPPEGLVHQNLRTSLSDAASLGRCEHCFTDQVDDHPVMLNHIDHGKVAMP